jgi:hypothetical protein
MRLARRHDSEMADTGRDSKAVHLTPSQLGTKE